MRASQNCHSSTTPTLNTVYRDTRERTDVVSAFSYAQQQTNSNQGGKMRHLQDTRYEFAQTQTLDQETLRPQYSASWRNQYPPRQHQLTVIEYENEKQQLLLAKHVCIHSHHRMLLFALPNNGTEYLRSTSHDTTASIHSTIDAASEHAWYPVSYAGCTKANEIHQS